MDPLEQLNDEQRAAASHTDGAVLIFAGAGSGKTRVLTHRIAYLLAGGKVPAHRILAVTFTNKAAGELRSRLQQLVGEAAHGLWVGTFHSIGVRMLRRSGDVVGVAPNFVIYDEADQRTLLKEILRDLNIDERNYHPGAVLRHISRAKERLQDPLAYADSADGQLSPVVASLYSEYQRRLNQANALDFDDLIMRTIALLERPVEGKSWRERFEYVLVDEYQDVNEAQYRMVRGLSQGSGNICVVGDDDQSIYAFRGADHRIILRFERDFHNAATVSPRTQLPLDVARAFRRQRARLAQHAAPSQEPVDQSRGRQAGPRLRRDDRARRGALRGRHDPSGRRTTKDAA